MKRAKLWYVIADGGRARFVARDEEGAFRTLSSFVSTELHKSTHELGRDRPARVKESASPPVTRSSLAAICTRPPRTTSSAPWRPSLPLSSRMGNSMSSCSLLPLASSQSSRTH